MSIYVWQELCLYLSTLKPSSSKNHGSYLLRLHLYYIHPSSKQLIFSTPTGVLSCFNRPTKIMPGHVNEDCYLSRIVPVRFSAEAHRIDEACLFHTKIDTSKFEDYRSIERVLYCQLMQELPYVQGEDKLVKCGEFTARLHGLRLHSFIEMRFNQKHCCVVNGSIHSATFNMMFMSNRQQVEQLRKIRKLEQQRIHIRKENEKLPPEPKIYDDIEQYLEGNSKQQVQPLLDFFIDMLQDQIRRLQQIYQECMEAIPHSENKLVESKRYEGILVEQRFKQRQRKRIFDSGLAKTFQGRVNKLANRIYSLWGKYVEMMIQVPDVILPTLKETYRNNIKTLFGQSVVRLEFESSDWTVEKYGDSGKEHLATAQKLRNLPKELDQMGKIAFLDQEMYLNREIRCILFDEIYHRPGKKNQMEESRKGRHLVFLVHGLGACKEDMEKMALELFRTCKLDAYISGSNVGRTDGDISAMGHRLAKQVIQHVNSLEKKPHFISFVGHSMGSIIVRAALPHLQSLRKLFHSYVSIGSPHIGYLYNSSTLVNAGLWVINSVQKCQSVIQLCMEDTEKLQDSFIYKLSQQKGLEWFNKVALVSSYQDSYVPYDCARIQKSTQAISDNSRGLLKGKRYCQMVDNIINRLTCSKLRRIDVNIQMPSQSVDTLIGRAAHIKFINCPQLIRLIVETCPDIFI